MKSFSTFSYGVQTYANDKRVIKIWLNSSFDSLSIRKL